MSVLEVKDMNILINGEIIIKGSSFGIEEGDVILLTGPNGSGKSTVIKVIMGDVFDYGNALLVSASELSFFADGIRYDLKDDGKARDVFRRSVCYISQEDDFESESVLDCFLMSLNFLKLNNPYRYVLDFIKRFRIFDGFGINDDNKIIKCRKILNKAGLREKDITTEYIKAAIYLSMNTKRMSGGQKKLTNIFANLIRCEFSKLVFFDEPLNNLDYNNVRLFSNTITMLHQSFPDVGMMIVTHCRSIPAVNRVLEIDTQKTSIVVGDDYICNSCFGKINEAGLYV